MKHSLISSVQYDFNSLVEVFGCNLLAELASKSFGIPIQTHHVPTLVLYLVCYDFYDNFVNVLWFRTNFELVFGYQPQTSAVMLGDVIAA